MRFKIDWAILIVGSKFTVFALFYFVFEGNCPSISPQGAYIWRGNLKEGFLRYCFGRLIFGGAYTWRGLFSEFYGIIKLDSLTSICMHSAVTSSTGICNSIDILAIFLAQKCCFLDILKKNADSKKERGNYMYI